MFKKYLVAASKIPKNAHTEFFVEYPADAVNHQLIEYFLIENCDFLGENNSYKYGLGISIHNNVNETEESIIESVSDSKERVENLLASLCKNSVTPVSLSDIISDLNSAI